MANRNPDYNFLPTNDPWWKAATAPLLRYVRAQGSVAIDDIVAWGKRARHNANKTKNMLAWLSFNGLVAYDELASVWKTTSVEQVERRRDEAV
jgi:ribosomal protein S19E (S16A)